MDETMHYHMPSKIIRVVNAESDLWFALNLNAIKLQQKVAAIEKKYGELCRFFEAFALKNMIDTNGNFSKEISSLNELADELNTIVNKEDDMSVKSYQIELNALGLLERVEIR